MAEATDGSLAEALRVLADEAEALLGAALDGDGAQLGEAARARLRQLRGRFEALAAPLEDGARALDRYVRRNPWQAIAIAGALGLGVGLLLGRRR
ncbi:MAG: DUF883 family protein [Gammaproteobacteria bacterium]|nr:DUF883 family protein [Gammaproteobacteria bacterium]